MPCWEINTMSVDINATNRDLLETAIKSLGLAYERAGNDFYVDGFSITEDQAILRSDQQYGTLNAIKRAYSKESIKKVAKAKGWTGAWNVKQDKQVIKLKKY